MNRILCYLEYMTPGLAAGALAWLLFRLRRGRTGGGPRSWAMLLFWMYSGGMAVITLAPEPWWVNFALGGSREPYFDLSGLAYRVSLIPFSQPDTLFNLIGNIVMFLPFGFFAALLWRGFGWKRALALGLGITCGIECWQLFVGRYFDIDDIILNTLGVLYIVENGGESVQSMADLKGKTIAAAGKGSTPEFGLRYLLEQNGLDPDRDVAVDWKSEHAECVAALAAGTADIALLPQPFVTVAQGKLENLRVALDLTEEWDALDNGSAMITGVAVARRDLVEERPELVEKFLMEYAGSVEWVHENTAGAAELVAQNGIIESPAIAEKALPRCNIVCLTGQEMYEKLSGYLQVLAEAAPESVGGVLPRDDFYYGA